MSQIVYRGNLSARSIPLLSDFQGRSVIVQGPDNTFNRSLASPQDSDQDVGVPMIYYGHNILPAPYGFHSVGYESLIPPTGLLDFKSVRLLRSNTVSSTVAGPRFYFSPKLTGNHSVMLVGASVWSTISNNVPILSTTAVTYATVQGISYIYFSGIGCYKYNSVTNQLVAVTLAGLTPSVIQGVTSAQGYLIAFDTQDIYWSSVLDIDYTLNTVDFVPSLTTGAGQIRPEGAKASITIVLPAAFGLTIYTQSNVVSAVYSGNSRYPFNFKEIVASGGCSDQNLVSYDANTGNQYAYTSSGMQTITSTATQTLFPEITDFIAGADFEDFDEGTLSFIRTKLTSPMVKRLTSVADRYLIMSYGVGFLSHAIVYDMTQKRYGKLKISHVDCFEYEYADLSASDAPRKSIAFLKPDGSIQIVNPSVTFSDSKGVILLGKFQYVRSRLISLEGVDIQAVHPTQTISAYNLSSITGGTLEAVTKTAGFETSRTGDSQRTYKFHKTAVNHSLLLVGGFFLTSFVLTFHIHGRR